jgi:membrane associated rhomboid family serine protease
MTDQDDTHAPLSRPVAAGLVAVSYVVLLYVIEVLDAIVPARLDGNGVHPRSIGGLDGVLFSPLLHGGWAHLIGNTVPLLVLGFLIALSGVRTWLQVTAVVWIVGGLGVWLVGGAGTNHIGASGIVFGWLSYLVVRGIFTRSLPQIALGIVVFAVYGSVLWGVLPGRSGVSWEAHLSGALSGALAAWLLAPRDDRARVS